MNEMATDARLTPERPASGPVAPEPPLPDVRRSRGISLVWLVPLVAAVIAGWLAWTTYARQGPLIQLYFESAEGLEADATTIKYREVTVGRVERIQIGSDLRRVVVAARLVEGAERFASEGTRFWIVRPRVGTGGVTGLGTLVSGAYIEVDPGPGETPLYEFTGLEEPPQIRSNVPGSEYVLLAESLGFVNRGSPVYYHGVEVGQVLGYDLAPDNQTLRVRVFVRAPHDRLVRTDSRFWNASGVSVSTGAAGVRVSLASIPSLFVGGVQFETPAIMAGTEPAPPGAEFTMFASAEAAAEANYALRERFLANFDGSSRGLRPGAPVELRGVRVGRVAEVQLITGLTPGALRAQALLEVAPDLVQVRDPVTGELAQRDLKVADYVIQGLRAQLKTGNLLTGELYVDLDFHPDAVPAEVDTGGRYPVIPTVPATLDAIQASATELLQKVASLPLDELVSSLAGTAAGLEKIVGAEGTQAAVAGLAQTLETLRATLAGVNEQAGPVGASLKASADAATATLRQAEGTFAALQRGLGPNSRLERDLGQTLEQLRDAARSVRGLSDYLERNPQALIRGKSGGYQ